MPTSLVLLCRCVAVTAATQACVLGLMRMFWILILQEDTELIAYVFAALNSLQGMMLFVVHCLLSEKVCVCVERELLGKRWRRGRNAKKKKRENSVKMISSRSLFCCPLQVRKEYACFFSRLCTPKKKRKRSYDFRGSNSPINHSQVCRNAPISITYL